MLGGVIHEYIFIPPRAHLGRVRVDLQNVFTQKKASSTMGTPVLGRIRFASAKKVRVPLETGCHAPAVCIDNNVQCILTTLMLVTSNSRTEI